MKRLLLLFIIGALFSCNKNKEDIDGTTDSVQLTAAERQKIAALQASGQSDAAIRFKDLWEAALEKAKQVDLIVQSNPNVMKTWPEYIQLLQYARENKAVIAPIIVSYLFDDGKKPEPTTQQQYENSLAILLISSVMQEEYQTIYDEVIKEYGTSSFEAWQIARLLFKEFLATL
ncbi:hypothetical protein JHJ32_01760 [Parapedobacter sp. ISTM3]|uniref:hypothetical protein n=1 Tax=Parapedobacter sp. ISTM3 TaxID=2800130 RepID=UPI0019086F09|nr:hypothetical protein [Parapedobacter sp. ISTM3]MBK1438703.1 hypothetical protein [Parapedobacter sp. ISTM3]